MRVAAVVAVSLAAAAASAAPVKGPVPKAKAAVLAEVDGLAPELARIAAELWTYSETALKEGRARPRCWRASSRRRASPWSGAWPACRRRSSPRSAAAGR